MANSKKPQDQETQNDEDLPNTLAQRIYFLRERRNLTRLDLSRRSHLSLSRIDAIESGEELWLSFTDRARLARSLGVTPSVLQSVEKVPPLTQSVQSPQRSDLEELVESILDGEIGQLCPRCGQKLKTSIENALDFEERSTRIARAYCPVCPFTLR